MFFAYFQPFSAGSIGSTGSMNYAPVLCCKNRNEQTIDKVNDHFSRPRTSYLKYETLANKHSSFSRDHTVKVISQKINTQSIAVQSRLGPNDRGMNSGIKFYFYNAMIKIPIIGRDREGFFPMLFIFQLFSKFQTLRPC